MKLDIKRIVRPLALRDYAEEYGDEVVWVWVNPLRAFRMRLYELADEFKAVRDRLEELAKAEAEAVEGDAEGGTPEGDTPNPEVKSLGDEVDRITGELHAWWAELWSQGQDEETHWTVGDVGELIEAARDSDPMLWDFLQERSMELSNAHREGVRQKKS